MKVEFWIDLKRLKRVEEMKGKCGMRMKMKRVKAGGLIAVQVGAQVMMTGDVTL